MRRCVDEDTIAGFGKINGAKKLLNGRQKICRLNTDTTLLLLSHVQISDILIVLRHSSSKDSTVEFQILEFASALVQRYPILYDISR
jgi:hypothetical protein